MEVGGHKNLNGNGFLGKELWQAGRIEGEEYWNIGEAPDLP